MAPGGFSAIAIETTPTARLRALTLSPDQGGHVVMLCPKDYSNDVVVALADVTLLAVEMGVSKDEIPDHHPDAGKFRHEPIFSDISHFNLIFCGGAVTRPHREQQATYRHRVEGLRLTVSQLVVAMSRVRHGGALVVLLHRPETWNTCQVMYVLSQFSRVRSFKPGYAHATRSSFYLIAEDVESESHTAKEAVQRWKALGRRLTLDTEPGEVVTGGDSDDGDGVNMISGENVDVVLGKFGRCYLHLSRPIWQAYARALKKAPWTKKAAGNGECGRAAAGGRQET
ncbi:hypothetical protein GE09DRAFT_176241 [Coniochaeta sp. 2T2.1]|nr:hypothetical protein GE09DRAFT_176241 [Coniochaeta sp. 2T2.1]